MTDLAEDIEAVAMPAAATGRRPTLTLDAALYDRYLEDSDLSPADRQALLEALWAVIVGFVDLGFAVEPAAAIEKAADGGNQEFASIRSALVDYSPGSTSQHFEQAATPATSSAN